MHQYRGVFTRDKAVIDFDKLNGAGCGGVRRWNYVCHPPVSGGFPNNVSNETLIAGPQSVRKVGEFKQLVCNSYYHFGGFPQMIILDVMVEKELFYQSEDEMYSDIYDWRSLP